MSKIEEYLKSMGNTSQEVAEHLEMLGIKGQKHHPQFCPIIKAIYHQFPNMSQGLKVDVYAYSAGYRSFGAYGKLWCEASSSVCITWQDCQTMDPTCPAAVAAFVKEFDEGKYPHLVGDTNKQVAEKALEKLTLEERMALRLCHSI